MAHLIDKDALVAEIERRIKTNKECMLGLKHLEYYQGKVDALNDTISSLDTLEVKDFWKPANGDNLPEIDREVVVLIKYDAQLNIYDEEYPTCGVGFGHRPDPKGWDGKSLSTGKVEHYTPKTYDKGGWNIPNIVYWLDCSMPNLEEG